MRPFPWTLPALFLSLALAGPLMAAPKPIAKAKPVAKAKPAPAPFAYRAVSVHTGTERNVIHLKLEPGLLKEAADVGFNTLVIMTEGSMAGKMEALRAHADANGYFKQAKSLGMTLGVWVREFQDLPTEWGTPALDNPALWNGLSQRYRTILTQTLPEIDHLILTVVESQIPVTDDGRILTKVIETVNNECRAARKKLVFRTFIHHPTQLPAIQEALAKMPKDVIVQTKCVPQDWHMRGLHDPLIGAVGGRAQYVEWDIAGEYFKRTFVANCFTDILEDQLKYAKSRGVTGISVRIDRYEHDIWGQAQEANLWFMGYWASGKSLDPAVAWRAYTESTFGKKAAVLMEKALRPTGQVIAEAICVERESFGDTRSSVPGFDGFKLKKGEPVTVRAPEGRSAFARNWSVWRWDDRYVPDYDRMRVGDPEVIARKTKALAAARSSALASLAAIDQAKPTLDQAAYAFFRWKLDENLFVLDAQGAMALAYLKALRRGHSIDPEEKARLTQEIAAHLDELQRLANTQGKQTAAVDWRGRHHILNHGAYLDLPRWIQLFREYAPD